MVLSMAIRVPKKPSFGSKIRKATVGVAATIAGITLTQVGSPPQRNVPVPPDQTRTQALQRGKKVFATKQIPQTKKPKAKKRSAKFSFSSATINGREHKILEFNPSTVEMKLISGGDTVQSAGFFIQEAKRKYGKRVITIVSGGYFDTETGQSVSALRSDETVLSNGVDLAQGKSHASIVFEPNGKKTLSVSRETNPHGRTVISNLVPLVENRKLVHPSGRRIDAELPKRRIAIALNGQNAFISLSNGTLEDFSADLQKRGAVDAVTLDSGNHSLFLCNGKVYAGTLLPIKSVLVLLKPE